MRKILFRGLHTYDNRPIQWVFGDLVTVREYETRILEEKVGYDTIPSQRVDPHTIGQYIGLNDKNGKQIFEGDILRGDIPECLHDSQNCIGFVRYEDSAFIVDFCRTREPWETQQVGFCSFSNYEVIGNIYDNPELLNAAATMHDKIAKGG